MDDTTYNYFSAEMLDFAECKKIDTKQAKPLFVEVLKTLNYNNPVVQHIGPEYFAAKILMENKLISNMSL